MDASSERGLKTVTVKSTIQLWPSFWKHPLVWYRQRHLRREVRRPRTELEKELDRRVDEALLHGDGS